MTLEELIGAQFPGVGTTAPPPTQLATLQAMFPGRVGNQAIQQSMYLNQRPQNSSQGFPPRMPGTQSPLATPPGRQPINTPSGQTPGGQTQQRTGTTATAQPFATYTGNESGAPGGTTTTTTGGGNALQTLMGIGGLGYGAYKAYPWLSDKLGLGGGSVTGGADIDTLIGGAGADTLNAGYLGNGKDILGQSNLFNTGSDLANTGINLGANFLGSFAGNKLGGLIGGSKRSGGDIGSSIGAIAGNFIPGIGQIPGVGSFIGSTIGKLIGGMFGAHPTTGPMSDATLTYGAGGYDLKPTQIDPGIRAGGKSQGVIDQLREATDPLGQTVKDRFAGLVEDIGGGLAGFDNVTVGTKYDKNSKSQKYYGGLQSDYLGGKPQLFDSPDQAIANAIYTALNSAKFGEGSDPNKLNAYKSQLYAMAFPQAQQQQASVSPDLSALMGIAA